MIASTIWKNLKSTLQNNPALSKYVKVVFDGIRYNVEPESLPCLMLEPMQNGEVDLEMNDVQNVYLNVNILAFSSSNFNEFDKTIAGDEVYKGILDIENDVRACLAASYTLGETVIDIKQGTSEFDTLEFKKYPVRGFVIPIKILYRQTNNV